MITKHNLILKSDEQTHHEKGAVPRGQPLPAQPCTLPFREDRNTHSHIIKNILITVQLNPFLRESSETLVSQSNTLHKMLRLSTS